MRFNNICLKNNDPGGVLMISHLPKFETRFVKTQPKDRIVN